MSVGVLVEDGGFDLVWYGRRVDATGRAVEVVASCGDDHDLIGALAECRCSAGTGGSTTCDAFAVGSTQVSADAEVRPAPPSCVSDGPTSLFRSTVALPVDVDGILDGVLTVHAVESGAFGPVVVGPLEQLARQIGMALSRVRTRERLVEALDEQLLLSTAIEQAGESVVVTDLDSTIVYANPATATTSGYPLDEIIGADPSLFSSGLHGPEFFTEIHEILASGQTWRGVVVNRTKSGELYEEDTSITPMHDAEGRVTSFVSVLRNITWELKLEADLDRLRSDRESVVQAMAGVRLGSTVEATAVSFCHAVTRLEDLAVARVLLVESDEAVVPLGITGEPYLDWQVGVPVGFAHLRDILEATRSGSWWLPLHPDSGAARANPRIVGILVEAGFQSIGFAPIWWEGEMVAVLTVVSRTAESERWSEARRTVMDELSSFAGTMIGAQASRRGEWRRHRDEIRAIIDTETFHPVFQAVIDIGTGAIHGYEALTRFANGRRPDLVFQEAHAVGLGIELETACASAAVLAAGPLIDDTWLAVNFSPATVIAGAVATVSALADRPLVVEVTEHVEVESYAAVRDAVRHCPGVRISVDDAGAGYASLRHILELQPDFVKLDIGLVRNIDSDPARQALAAGLRHYAEATGTVLIAEGVETPAEHGALHRLGIPLGQGYLFGRPNRLGQLAGE